LIRNRHTHERCGSEKEESIVETREKSKIRIRKQKKATKIPFTIIHKPNYLRVRFRSKLTAGLSIRSKFENYGRSSSNPCSGSGLAPGLKNLNQSGAGPEILRPGEL
jgi:hypothetical protein